MDVPPIRFTFTKFAAEISSRSFCCSSFVPVRKGSRKSGSKKASIYVETLKIDKIPLNSRIVEALAGKARTAVRQSQ